MGLRLNKEIKIDVCDNINLKYGSVNKNDPQIIYVSGKMWISPSYEGDFETPINIIHSNFKKELTKSLRESSIFESKHILDFDINPLTMTKDKKSFFQFHFILGKNLKKLLI